MFFYLSKIFAGFFFPYPLFVLLSLIAAWRLKRSKFRALFRVAVVAVFLLSLNSVSGWLIGGLEEQYAYRATEELAADSDAIIVLAGMIDPLTGIDDRPEFLGSADRIFAGEELLRARKAPELIVSGGSGLILQTGTSEAVILPWKVQMDATLRYT